MYFNYSLTEYFTLIQITIGYFKAIDLWLKQGKFYYVAKAERKRLENKRWICWLKMKLSEIRRMLRPGNNIFKVSV